MQFSAHPLKQIFHPKDLAWTLQWKGGLNLFFQGCFGPQNDASFEGPMILRADMD